MRNFQRPLLGLVIIAAVWVAYKITGDKNCVYGLFAISWLFWK